MDREPITFQEWNDLSVKEKSERMTALYGDILIADGIGLPLVYPFIRCLAWQHRVLKPDDWDYKARKLIYKKDDNQTIVV
jgi:hypothetical protein